MNSLKISTGYEKPATRRLTNRIRRCVEPVAICRSIKVYASKADRSAPDATIVITMAKNRLSIIVAKTLAYVGCLRKGHM